MSLLDDDDASVAVEDQGWLKLQPSARLIAVVGNRNMNRGSGSKRYMRCCVALAALLASGCAEPAPPLPPGPGVAPASEAVAQSTPPAVPKHFRLTLAREQDGGWQYLRCTLHLLVEEGPAAATLTCETRDGATVRAWSEVSAAEVQDLRDVLEQADIYDLPHAGVDRGLVHWRFETVTLRPLGLGMSGDERAVVLVASGNESFKAGARGKLLYTLWQLHDELEARVPVAPR